jgi:hypothetical protein
MGVALVLILALDKRVESVTWSLHYSVTLLASGTTLSFLSCSDSHVCSGFYVAYTTNIDDDESKIRTEQHSEQRFYLV